MSEMGEAITTSFVEAALTIWERLLSDQDCKGELMACEERWGKKTPWDSVYKLEILVRKCGKQSEKSLENQRWALKAVSDGITDGHLDASCCSVRNLSGKGQPGGRGTVDHLLFKKNLRSHVIGTMCASLPLTAEEKVDIDGMFQSHKTYREAFGFATEPKSRIFLSKYDASVKELIILLGDVIFGGGHDANVRYCVKQALSVEDFFERAEAKEKLDLVTSKLKEARFQATEADEEEIDDTAAADHTIAMGFKVGDMTSQDISKQLEGQPDDIKATLKERFERAKVIASLEDHEAEIMQGYSRKAIQTVLDKVELLPDQAPPCASV